MASIKFSNTTSVTAATSINVPLGGSPNPGDLVLVFLLTGNEIVTHQPGWASEFTAAPNPWFKLEGLRTPDAATLSGWYHTWNASDSGSSVTFTFIPAPTLGIGDKDIPNTDALATAIVLDGTSSTAVLEHNIYGTSQDLVSGTIFPPNTHVPAEQLKKPAALAFHVAAASGAAAAILDSDGLSSEVSSGGLTTPNSTLSINVYQRPSSPAGYRPTFSLQGLTSPASIMIEAVSVSDNQPQIYNPPYIEEGPMADNRMMFRYRLNRFFTVLNNGGVFTAVRYQSTDQIAAATQVFTNNQPISATDRASIIASGVGGDFLATS
jgi:hypothetical protein